MLSDHPSFRSFVVENTLLFIGFFAVGIAFLGITFNGSTMASGLLLLGLAIVLLVLLFRRLAERYTSYVVTDARIMRIKGIVSRRAHSIPWVRVTDLTIDQSLTGRLFGYATLHIESANEDSGLRDLEGVSDPMRFNQFVVDMVVAKQGTTEPAWRAAGEPGPPSLPRGLRRVRMSRRRRGDEIPRGANVSAWPSASPGRRPSAPACPAPAPSAARRAGPRRPPPRRPPPRRPRPRLVLVRLGAPTGPTTSRPSSRSSMPRPSPPASGAPATRPSTGPTTTARPPDGRMTVRRGRVR